ncbi:MAG: hypothetical protein QOH05_767 [Acetobacteraceae bacterium]|jgi:hypothetical protein|nr:hypothetical protein [Acetobacteraceae bacterium]
MRIKFWLAGVGAGVLAASAVGVAATSPEKPAQAPPAAHAPAYVPVTSDLMNAVIQPRHIKLWLAGKSKNWVFADYERHNIGGALARMATAIPTYHGSSTKELIAAFATPGLADLDKAIKAKDETAFADAYRGLTTGCNGCHQATGHEMVVVKVPDSNPFSDQDFAPPSN